MPLKVLIGLIGICLLAACGDRHENTLLEPPAPSGSSTPDLTIHFANLPYGDHTYSEIGIAKGFFREAHLNVMTETIRIEDVVAGLANGRFQVASVPPGILFGAHDTAPGLRTFVFGDLFQGYALMADSHLGLKTYAEFRAGGMDHHAAVAATVQQIKGHTFAYPTETAIKPFIDLLLTQAGLGRESFTSMVLDDPLTVNAMRRGQAQFQVGGVPSRITLQKEGFVPLISSVDLARGARPSADSPELASILENGWATTADFYSQHHAAVLRLASVNYRIMNFMATHPQEALRIHMDYLSKVTGQSFTAADGAVIYKSLDPFVTFEDQHAWFYDTTNPLYYAYVNGAILKSFMADGVYKKAPPTVEDVIFADDIYRELEELKLKCETRFKAIDDARGLNPAPDPVGTAREYYDHYDFYDALQTLELIPQ